jgi:hypothetical protein
MKLSLRFALRCPKCKEGILERTTDKDIYFICSVCGYEVINNGKEEEIFQDDKFS